MERPHLPEKLLQTGAKRQVFIICKPAYIHSRTPLWKRELTARVEVAVFEILRLKGLGFGIRRFGALGEYSMTWNNGVRAIQVLERMCSVSCIST